jgi:hypothetical protein
LRLKNFKARNFLGRLAGARTSPIAETAAALSLPAEL